MDVWPRRLRHHFGHTWLDRGRPEGDLMELNGWSSPQMLRRYGVSACSARAAPTTASWKPAPDDTAPLVGLRPAVLRAYRTGGLAGKPDGRRTLPPSSPGTARRPGRHRRDRHRHNQVPRPGHLASWCGRTPLDRQSGKRAGQARHKKGNRYVAAVAGETSVAAGKNDTPEGAYHRRLVRRRGKNKAAGRLRGRG